MPTKLTVTTEFGTFKRSTVRVYTHLVIVQGYKAERIEASRLAGIKENQKTLAKYRQTVATGISPDWRQAGTISGDWDRKCTAEALADGSYAGYVANVEAELTRLEAIGPITQDLNTWGLDAANLASTPAFLVAGWCGRLDLARKLAAKQAESYRLVAIIDVATGQVVR